MPSRDYLIKSESSGILPSCYILEDKEMEESSLYDRLLSDLALLNIPIDEVTIEFRPYSVTYFGKYFLKNHLIAIYPYADKQGDFVNSETILETAIHESVHHIQYQDPNFIRRRGVMHDTQFWKIYNHFIDRAVKLNIVEEGRLKKHA